MAKKYFYYILLVGFILLLATGCAQKVVYKDRLVFVELDENLFKSCNKPTMLKADFPEITNQTTEALSNLPSTRIVEKYSITKIEHVACYGTVYNIKTAYKAALEKLKAENGTPPK